MNNLQLTLFDYNQLDTETRIVVQQRTSEIKALMKRTAQDIIEIGEKLIEVKGRLPHGAFGGWLESEFGWGTAQAARFMQVAERFGDKIYQIDKFAPSALYLLAAPSTPDEARAEAISRAEAGERVTHQAAKEIVNGYKQPSNGIKQCGICSNLYDAGKFQNCPYCYKKQHGLRTGFIDGLVEMVNNNVDLTGNPKPVSPFYEQSAPILLQADAPVSYFETPMGQAVGVTIFSHESVEYYTPMEYIEAVREVFGGYIDLDPASCKMAQQTVKAKRYYTVDDDGYSKRWGGKVFLNPPYSKTGGDSNQGLWSNKLIEEYESGDVTEAILLVKAALGYNWFEDIWVNWPVCFSRERLSFQKPDGTTEGKSKQASAIFYLGPNVDRFREIFKMFGRVIMPEGWR